MIANRNILEMKDLIWEAKFGIEKESLRVTPEGFLAHTPHPFPDNPKIERDFCENQVEVITGADNSVEEMYAELCRLQTAVLRTMKTMPGGPEYLWPFSNPPYVKGETDIPIAVFEGDLKEEQIYREYLAEKYGKKKMLYSGIHFNFSFGEELLKCGFQESGQASYQAYKDQVYLELSKKMTAYSWLVVYLTAASPVMDASFIEGENMDRGTLARYASARCSEIGYWNPEPVVFDFHSPETYLAGLQEELDSGRLRELGEFYYPVRLKPTREYTIAHLRENGIDHMEIRTIDLNPLSPYGFMIEDAKFLHLLFLYLASLPDAEFDADAQLRALRNVKRAAWYDDTQILIETGAQKKQPIREAALEVLREIERFFAPLTNGEVQKLIQYQKEKITDPDRRYAARIRKAYGDSFVKRGMELIKAYTEQLTGTE